MKKANFKAILAMLLVGVMGVSMTACSGNGDTASSGKRHALVFRHVPGGRELTFRMEGFLNRDTIEGHLLLTQEPEESMVICTPFHKRGHFYSTEIIACAPAGVGQRARPAPRI